MADVDDGTMGRSMALSVVAQVAAYALFALAGMVVWVSPLAATVSLCVLAVAACAVILLVWPFGSRETGIGFARALAALAAVVGMAGALLVRFSGRDSGDALYGFWGALTVGVLLVVVVVSFGRQMLRRDRLHLIVSLSTGIMASLTAFGGVCWVLLPSLIADVTRLGAVAMGISAVVVLAVAVLMVMAAAYWSRGVIAHDVRHGGVGAGTRSVCVGVGLAGAMLTGPIVYVVVAVLHLL